MASKVRTSASKTWVRNRLNMSKGEDIASANNITLGTDGNQFDITGTTAVMRINPTNFKPGAIVVLNFDGAAVVHHAEGTDTDTAKSLKLQGATDFTTAAGDRLVLYYDGALWQEISRCIVAGIAAESIAPLAVGTSELASAAVTKAKALVFFSTETLATGSEQSVAHGLGAAPAGVLIAMTEHPGTPDTGAMDIAEGTHTTTNVVFTATANIKVKILAWG